MKEILKFSLQREDRDLASQQVMRVWLVPQALPVLQGRGGRKGTGDEKGRKETEAL